MSELTVGRLEISVDPRFARPIPFLPTADRKPEINGTLRNARRVAKGEDPRAPCLYGQVYGDTKGRFRDGEYITTSTIFSEDGDIFTTRYSAYRVESWADRPAATQTDEDAFMVPGMGAQPVPPANYNPANDNEPSGWPMQDVPPPRGSDRGKYIGLMRALNQSPDDFQLPDRKGPYIATATGGKFYPLDPRPSEVDIRHIARSHSMQCRYNGAVRRFYSVAEHATLIARSLIKEHGKRVALAGLLHDSPEAYTGFGDVVSPMKSEFPFIGEMEDNIYRKAIAPHFGLDAEIPEAVHIADMRIRGNEVANLVPMAWHEEYDNPLPVPMMYWSPAEAEREFLATYTTLTGEVV